MMGVHNLAMECLMRASSEKQTIEGVDANINRATKLLRTFTTQMEPLNRHRGKVSHDSSPKGLADKWESARGPGHRSEVRSQDASWHSMSVARHA